MYYRNVSDRRPEAVARAERRPEQQTRDPRFLF